MDIVTLAGLSGDRIALEITKVPGFPGQESIEGGYDLVCALTIDSGSCHVRREGWYSATGALRRFAGELKKCHKTLGGEAAYGLLYEDLLRFKVTMGTRGRAAVTGVFREDAPGGNRLAFAFETDQSFFADTIRAVEALCGKYGGGTA